MSDCHASCLQTSLILALYLSHLLDKKAVSAVSMAHAAYKWAHSILPKDRKTLWMLDFAKI